MNNTNKRSKREIIDFFNSVLKHTNYRFNRKNITESWKSLMKEIQFFVSNQEEIFKEYDDEFAYKDYYDCNQEPEEMLNLKDTLEFCIFCLADELEAFRDILLDKTYKKEEKTILLEEMLPRLSFWVKHARELFEKRNNVNAKNANDENGNDENGNDENAKNDNEKIVLPFEIDPTYRIFFAGNSLEDIQSLRPNVAYKLISKLSDPLAQAVLIKDSEGIGKIRDKYKLSFARIRFAYDYRIIYTRHNKLTIILGIPEKTGKDNDYTKYAIYARRITQIHNEADEFCNGQSTEYNEMVYEYLRKVYREALMRNGNKDVMEEEK